jgi:hypothetical protein
VVEQRPFKPKVVGSIPTAPTNHPSNLAGHLAKEDAKRGIRSMIPFVRQFSAARVTTGFFRTKSAIEKS